VVLIPVPAYRVFREAYRRGDTDTVLGTGQHVLDALAAADDPRQQELAPAVLVMIGAHLARTERFVDAIAYLERGLGDLPGTEATRDIGRGDWYAVTLVQLYLLVGRPRDAWPLIQRLLEPDHKLETRLGATRAQVMVAAGAGEFEMAYQLLNTAAGLADRLRNRQQSTMVGGDRALVLAYQGRMIEAVGHADAVLPMLSQPVPGPMGAWAAAEAVAVSTTVARHAAEAGDLMTAQRLVFGAGDVAERTGRSFDRAQLALARGVVAWRSGSLLEAEAPLADARRTFLELGCAPAAARAQWEEANLAQARGLLSSARPLLERARQEFATLGLAREVARIDLALAT
jgi:hypothetical protein